MAVTLVVPTVTVPLEHGMKLELDSTFRQLFLTFYHVRVVPCLSASFRWLAGWLAPSYSNGLLVCLTSCTSTSVKRISSQPTDHTPRTGKKPKINAHNWKIAKWRERERLKLHRVTRNSRKN